MFYNGDGVVIPNESETCHWNDYKNPDSTKLAWLCAESWRSKGFKVKQFKTKDGEWFYNGRLSRSNYLYNSFFVALHSFMVMHDLDEVTVTTTDVINFRFYPAQWSSSDGDFAVFNHSFTTAAFRASRSALFEICHILEHYDKGDLPEVPLPLVHDEGILRYYFKNFVCIDVMSFAPDFTKPLVHVSRSTLQHFEKDLL